MLPLHSLQPIKHDPNQPESARSNAASAASGRQAHSESDLLPRSELPPLLLHAVHASLAKFRRRTLAPIDGRLRDFARFLHPSCRGKYDAQRDSVASV